MRRRAAALLLVTALAVAGCGAQDQSGGNAAMPTPTPTGSGPSSAQPPPKVGPSTPSDYIPGDKIAGRVVKGGTGPCYALVTDDGRRYALWSDRGLRLDEGTYITAVVEELKVKISCGEGIHKALVSFNGQ
ncbi:hypothetical protein O7635_06910 [Asanoa sp. WMMD1127]|uniref:hypothetical protein n=1 Tax=Asanoa sp. WMMD1127 TaxID=3016107 RepID=UPI00241749B9|nr:hypothetical protein [Asanoa sp. WMMD1127]MDG4821584.1 hypothetical protein [Asanoa sp. WMMD1127]